MTPDLWLVMGLVLAVFSIPSMVSAWTIKQAPRVSAVVILIAGAMILYALRLQPEGYTLSDIPEAVVRVIAHILK